MVAHVAQNTAPTGRGGEGGDEMGYGERRGEKKAKAEGKTINQDGWSLQDWKANSPCPPLVPSPTAVSCSSQQALTPAPPPLPTCSGFSLL